MRADGYIRRVIAEKLGVTPERIRQIEAKALEKLRESAEK